MNAATKVLRDEHEVILKMLDAQEATAERMESGALNSQHLLPAICGSLEYFHGSRLDDEEPRARVALGKEKLIRGKEAERRTVREERNAFENRNAIQRREFHSRPV